MPLLEKVQFLMPFATRGKILFFQIIKIVKMKNNNDNCPLRVYIGYCDCFIKRLMT